MMRVSQRLDCALRALVELADRGEGERVSAGAVAARLGLPRRFCEQQLTALARAGIVECRRGGGGGCSLTRPAGEVTLADVVTAVEGGVLDVPHTAMSATAEAWASAGLALGDALAGLTLADVAVRQRELDAEAERESRVAPMYHI